MEDRPKDSAIEKFFASRIGLARIGSFKQLENKLKNQKGKFPSFAINLALDDDVLFSAATKVDLLPPIEEAQEGLLYIKKPENLLFFPSLDTDPKEWIPIAGTGGAGGTVTIQQGKVDDVKVDGVSVLNTATKIANIDLSNKVDKVTGKGLSTNDFTNELKTKLDAIETNAQKNKIEVIKDAGGQVIPINNGEVRLPASATVDAYTKAEANTRFVEKENNKVLSSNDFTNALKTKLENLNENAEANLLNGVKTHDGVELPINDKKITLPDFALKSDLSSVYKVKGSKASYLEIDAITNKNIGDVYNATDTGSNYVWTGTEWDNLGGTIDLTNYYNKTQLDTKLDTKVDKEAGKGLSTNDFTNDLKAKLENISNNANKNVQVDWNEADTGSDAFIKNKPTIPAGSVLYASTGTHTDGAIDQKTTTDELNKKVDKEIGKTLTSNDFTTELKDKLTAIEASAQVNKIEEIKTADGVALAITNKSITLPAAAAAIDAYTKTQSDDKYIVKETGKTLTSNDFTNELKTKLEGVANNANKNVQADWNEVDTNSDSFIKNKPVIPAGSVLYDATGAHTDGSITQKVVTEELNKKVDKVDGKGLSDNNFTLMDKAKLGNIEMYAQVNKIEEIQTHDGTPLTITDKKVKLPELTVDAYTKAQADGKFVTKETGKGLSTNDLTNELKAKIENAKNGGAYSSTTRLEQTIGQSKVIAIGSISGLTIDKVVENGTLIYDDNNGIGVVEEIAGNALKVKTISLGSITNTKNDIQLTYSQDFYSQQEQTVGYYMGKPLYQITIPKLFPSKPNGTQEVGAIPGLERVVEVDGVIMNASSQVSYMISHQEMGGTKFINITGNSNDDKISITVGSAMPNGPYLVELTVKYTKKTDAAANENAMPLNNLLINRPDLWKLNKTYSFGNFVAGARFRGVVQTGKTILDIPTSMVGQPFPLQPTTIVNSNIVIYNGSTERHTLSLGYYGQNNFISGLYIPSPGQAKFAFETSDNYVGKNYDVWVLFKPNSY